MIVITGAKGFIGSCLSVMAARHGRVLALDDESRGLNDVQAVDNVHYVKHDCRGGIGEAVAAMALREPISAVVHLAAGTGSLDRPYEELVELNVEMTKRVYHDAVTLGEKAFVFPTTSLALGVPDSPYVRSKEDAFEWLKNVDERRIGIPLRFFNVIGAYRGRTEVRQREVHIIPTMLEAWRKGKPFVINGTDYDTEDGTPSRDFTNVVDIVSHILHLIYLKLNNALTIKPARDGAFWLGTGQSTTVLQMVDLFKHWWAADIEVEFGPRRAFDCGVLKVDQAQKILFEEMRRGLTPVWVGVRDEVSALQYGTRNTVLIP